MLYKSTLEGGKYICTQHRSISIHKANAKKEEIDRNTIIVGDFNTSFTTMDRSSREKINKETLALNDTTGQIDLIDIYRTFHPKTTTVKG